MEASYREDIFSQPEYLKICAEMLENGRADLEQLRGKGYKKIVFTGMGSSNYCSVTADRFLVQHGWTSFRYSAAELLYSYLNVIKEDTLLVITSQSGESAEILKLLKVIPSSICIVGITNDPNSTLAQRSNFTFLMNVDQEKSVTTRTYMAGIAVTLFLAMGLSGFSYSYFLNGLLKAGEEMKKMLKQLETGMQDLEENARADLPIWVLGRGIDYGTASAGALFLREVSRSAAIVESCGEFRHGPFEVVDENFLGILVSTGKELHEVNKNLIRDIKMKGGKLLVISDQKDANPTVLLPNCEMWYGQFLAIIPIQLIADFLAEKKGITAGEFRWGSKITKVE